MFPKWLYVIYSKMEHMRLHVLQEEVALFHCTFTMWIFLNMDSFRSPLPPIQQCIPHFLSTEVSTFSDGAPASWLNLAHVHIVHGIVTCPCWKNTTEKIDLLQCLLPALCLSPKLLYSCPNSTEAKSETPLQKQIAQFGKTYQSSLLAGYSVFTSKSLQAPLSWIGKGIEKRPSYFPHEKGGEKFSISISNLWSGA